jgi:NAD(P)-dependent dehydrogenase (short-subunit alcohol dehydrogenase family)
MSSRLENKVAIITGAGSGLGEAAAKRFGSEGAAVLCADIDGDAAERVAEAIVADGGRARAAVVDVTELQDTERMAAQAVDTWGTIDVLYANAGISGPGSPLTCEPATWDRLIAVNLTGVWYSVRAVLPTMLSATRGSLILQTSVAGLIGARSNVAYTAAKGGVVAMGRQLAAEYGRYGVRTNCIAPAMMMTPLVTQTYRRYVDEGRYASLDTAFAAAGSLNPMGRIGTPDECANLALFLASDEASWINGVVCPIDGGLTATREHAVAGKPQP